MSKILQGASAITADHIDINWGFIVVRCLLQLAGMRINRTDEVGVLFSCQACLRVSLKMGANV